MHHRQAEAELLEAVEALLQGVQDSRVTRGVAAGESAGHRFVAFE